MIGKEQSHFMWKLLYIDKYLNTNGFAYGLSVRVRDIVFFLLSLVTPPQIIGYNFMYAVMDLVELSADLSGYIAVHGSLVTKVTYWS